MHLTDLPVALMERLIATWRRRIIAGVVIAAFGLAVVVHAIEAARLALEPVVGPVGARLILIGVFALIIAATATWVLLAERRAAARRANQPFGSDENVSMISEALYFGYGLARALRGQPVDPCAPETAPRGDEFADADAAQNGAARTRPH